MARWIPREHLDILKSQVEARSYHIAHIHPNVEVVNGQIRFRCCPKQQFSSLTCHSPWPFVKANLLDGPFRATFHEPVRTDYATDPPR